MRLLTGLLSICYRGELEIGKGLRDYTELRRQLQNIGKRTAAVGRHGAPDEVMTIS
jgi:hypothetical protein